MVDGLEPVQHLAARTSRFLAACMLAGLLSACAGAPVQEMSDARQALAAAEQADAATHAPVDMADARHYLDAAQAALDAGDYSTAREDAQLARRAALKALMKSQGQDGPDHAPR